MSEPSIPVTVALAAAIGAIVSALVSSLINGLFNLRIKQQELERQDAQLAATLTRIKHDQIVAMQDWSLRSTGLTRDFDVWDPLVEGVGYLRGLSEFRKTGHWKGEDEAPHEIVAK